MAGLVDDRGRRRVAPYRFPCEAALPLVVQSRAQLELHERCPASPEVRLAEGPDLAVLEPLKVRELFDPDDALSQWVFALSATVADLGAAESLFKHSLDADEPAVRTLYLYRQVLARLYEAERVVAAMDTHGDVSAFLSGLPMSQAPADYLRAHFLPIDSSRVRATYGYARHRTVHHAHIGSTELRESLSQAGDQNARILVDVERKRLLYEWPEAVLAHGLSPDLGTSAGLAAFAERARLAQEILDNFAGLLKAAMHPYADHVGVEVDRLYHDIRHS